MRTDDIGYSTGLVSCGEKGNLPGSPQRLIKTFSYYLTSRCMHIRTYVPTYARLHARLYVRIIIIIMYEILILCTYSTCTCIDHIYTLYYIYTCMLIIIDYMYVRLPYYTVTQSVVHDQYCILMRLYGLVLRIQATPSFSTLMNWEWPGNEVVKIIIIIISCHIMSCRLSCRARGKNSPRTLRMRK